MMAVNKCTDDGCKECVLIMGVNKCTNDGGNDGCP